MDRKEIIHRLKEVAAGKRKPDEIDATNKTVIRVWVPLGNGYYKDQKSGLVVLKGAWDNEEGSKINPQINVVIVYPDDYVYPPLASSEDAIDRNRAENLLKQTTNE